MTTFCIAFYESYLSMLHRASPGARIFKAQETTPRNQFRQPVCSLAGRYGNPIHTRFLAPIDCLKIPTLKGINFPAKSIPAEESDPKEGHSIPMNEKRYGFCP